MKWYNDPEFWIGMLLIFLACGWPICGLFIGMMGRNDETSLEQAVRQYEEKKMRKKIKEWKSKGITVTSKIKL